MNAPPMTAPPPASRQRRGGLVQEVVQHLLQQIETGQLQPGHKLPTESEVMNGLGVSRTVVREAIKSLIAKGLLITGPKLGTRVLSDEQWNWFDPDVIRWQVQAGLTPEFLRDLQELRLVVEPAAVRMAAEKASAKAAQRLSMRSSLSRLLAGARGRAAAGAGGPGRPHGG